jgi:AcrR family transcriptional regulator
VTTQELIDAALRVAERVGWQSMTRDAVAQEAGCSAALVSHHLGTMDALRRTVMRAAVTRRVARVVAEGIIARDRHALRADPALRDAAAALVAGRR